MSRVPWSQYEQAAEFERRVRSALPPPIADDVVELVGQLFELRAPTGGLAALRIDMACERLKRRLLEEAS